MATKAGGVFIEIRGSDKHLKGDLDTAHRKIDSAATGMQSRVTRAFKVMSVAAVASIAAITAAITKSVLTFAPFEVALNRLGNVSDKTIKAMRAEILGLSSELGSVTNLTKGYYQVMSAGITDTDKAMRMLRVSAKMSLEATIEQSEAVKGLAAIMGAYSNELKTATEAADLLYTIEKSGITSVGELIPLIGNLANLAKTTGLSSNEMAAALAQITTTGAGTAISVTQLQSLLTALNRQFSKLPPEIQKYGTAIEAVKALGFQGVLKELMDYTEGNATVLGKMLGRQEGFLALLQLSKNEFSDYGDRLGSMADKVGAFDDAWKRYSKTLTAIWDTFKNSVGRQAILLGEKLAPKIKEVTMKMSNWIEKNDELISQKVSEYIDKIGTSVATLVEVYNSLPEGVVSAAGLGIIGTMLFGPKAGAVIALISLTSTKIDQFKRDHPEIFAPQPKILRFKIEMPPKRIDRPLASPAVVSGIPALPAPIFRKSLDNYETFLVKLEAMKERAKGAFAISEESWEMQFGVADTEAYNVRLKAVADFNQQYAEMGKSRFEIERMQLDEQIKVWEAAGIKQTQIAELSSSRIKQIKLAETTEVMGMYANMAGQVANTFMQIAQAGGKQSKKAFMIYKAFAIVQAGISGTLAYLMALGDPTIPITFARLALSKVIMVITAAQIAMIAAAKPPSYDQGGISNAKGVYQTGDIAEAHIPIPSGGKIPVKVEGSGQQGPVVNINMSNPVFQDVATQRQVFAQIATVIATQVAPGAVIQSYRNDEPIRSVIRGRA